LRSESHEVEEISIKRRQPVQQRVGDRRDSSAASARQCAWWGGRHQHRVEWSGDALHPELELNRFAEGEKKGLRALRSEPHVSNLDNVRPAHLEPLHHESALPHLSLRGNSRGSIEDADRRSVEITSVFAPDRATNCGCCDALRGRGARRANEGEREKDRLDDEWRRSLAVGAVSEKRGTQRGFTTYRKWLHRVNRL